MPIKQPVGGSPSNYALVTVNQIPVRALIDTGSCVSLIKRSFADKLKLPMSKVNSRQFQSASGSCFGTTGPVDLNVNINGLTVPYCFYIAETLPFACIIGCDFLEHAKGHVDLSRRLLTLYDGLVTTKLATSDSQEQPVALIKNVVVPAMSEAIVQVKLVGECRYNDVLIEPRTKACKSPLWVARCLVRPSASALPCRVLNPTDKDIKLRRNMHIGQWGPAKIPAQQTSPTMSVTAQNHEIVTDEQKDAVLKEKGISLADTAFTGDYYRRLRDLLYRYADIFATSLKDLPGCDVMKVTIDTGNSPPIAKRNYRFNPDEKKIIRAQIAEMEDAGIIRLSDSPWQAPIFLVDKVTPTGMGKRLIIDLRYLNAVSKMISWPLMTFESCIDGMAEQNPPPCFWASLDQKSGYYNICLDEKSQEKTGFSSPDAVHWVHTRLPMGWTG